MFEYRWFSGIAGKPGLSGSLMAIVNERFSVGGMQCPGCEDIIEDAISRLRGVCRVRADYGSEAVEVTFDTRKANPARIAEAILRVGYTCSTRPSSHRRSRFRTLLPAAVGLAGIALILLGGRWIEHIRLPDFDQPLSYGLLFFIGFLSSFHCVGMCGAFVVGYTARNAARRRRSIALSHLSYGFGKTLSYTVIGGLFGLLGSVIAFTPLLRGVVAGVAGLILVWMGLGMLKVFPKIRPGIRMPRWLRRFLSGEFRRHRSPLAIGLLNGLMIACGPLQAMYVMAAGTGSFVEGARRLFVFGSGTLPVLLSFGVMASLVSHRVTGKILKLSAFFVMVLGLVMLNRGLTLTGTGYDIKTLAETVRLEWVRRIEAFQADKTAPADHQLIRMAVTRSGYRPDTFVLRQGVPVRWVIEGRELTDCNRRILVPSLGLDIELVEGEQTIEFVPIDAGVIPWSCWMGMIPGSFVVQPAENPSAPDGPAPEVEIQESPGW